MVKFLIIRFSSIGDIIQCMDVINGIKNHFPTAEIHWITRKDMGAFLCMDKRIDRVWGFDKQEGLKGLLRMARQLKAEKFDYIYDAHSNIRSNILKCVLNSPFRGKANYTLRSKERWKRLLWFHFRINHCDQPFRGVVSFRKPLAGWGITDFTSNYSDWSFPTDYPKRLQEFIHANTITLVPSANWEMKRWPVEYWQQLILGLSEFHFLILAGPADTFCESIRSVAPERVLNLSGKTSLLESCFLVKQSHFVSPLTGLYVFCALFVALTDYAL